MTAEEILHTHAALLEGHFRLSSGQHSSRYLQCAVALQHPQAAAALGQALVNGLSAHLSEAPQVVVSPALGGLIIGHEVGRALGIRACFTERVDGQMAMRRGFHLEPGERAVMVEDVITTGLSSRETLAVIRAMGIDVTEVEKRLSVGGRTVVDIIEDGTVGAVVNTVTGERSTMQDGFDIRRSAVMQHIPCFTSIDTARCAVESGGAVEAALGGQGYNIKTLAEYLDGVDE